MYQITLVLDHEEEHLETLNGQADVIGVERQHLFLKAGTPIKGMIYVDLTKTVIGTYISLEFIRKEQYIFSKHGKVKTTSVLLDKLQLKAVADNNSNTQQQQSLWKNGYMKPGKYQIPFIIPTQTIMIPSSSTTTMIHTTTEIMRHASPPPPPLRETAPLLLLTPTSPIQSIRRSWSNTIGSPRQQQQQQQLRQTGVSPGRSRRQHRRRQEQSGISPGRRRHRRQRSTGSSPPQQQQQDKVITYILKMRFPGDRNQRAYFIKEQEIHISSSKQQQQHEDKKDSTIITSFIPELS